MYTIKDYVLSAIPERYNGEQLKFTGRFQRGEMETPEDFLYYCTDKNHLERVLDVMAQYDDETSYSHLAVEVDWSKR